MHERLSAAQDDKPAGSTALANHRGMRGLPSTWLTTRNLASESACTQDPTGCMPKTSALVLNHVLRANWPHIRSLHTVCREGRKKALPPKPQRCPSRSCVSQRARTVSAYSTNPESTTLAVSGRGNPKKPHIASPTSPNARSSCRHTRAFFC
jgi:hypothetical protein